MRGITIKHLRIYQTQEANPVDCVVEQWCIDSRISNLWSRPSNLRSRILNLDSWISILESWTSNLCSRISVLESPFSNLESRIRCQVLSELLTGTSEFWRTTSSSRSQVANWMPKALKWEKVWQGTNSRTIPQLPSNYPPGLPLYLLYTWPAGV